MSFPTGPTNKRKNCNSWAEYEQKGASDTAKLCHGGVYQDEWHIPCPSRHDCAEATRQKESDKRRLPIAMNPAAFARRSTPPTPQPRILVSSSRYAEAPKSLSRLPTYRRHEETRTTPKSYIEGGPIPVVPPQDYPEVMRTPYALADHPAASPLTPVFLPDTKERVLPRLLLNMIQGALGAGAQHVMEYMRYVDIFGSANPRP